MVTGNEDYSICENPGPVITTLNFLTNPNLNHGW